MGLFNFGKKKAEEQTEFSRIEAEDMIDNGYTCKEIAQELGTSEETIYRIKQAKTRRAARMGGRQPNGELEADDVQLMRREIEKAKLQDQLEEIQHRNYLRQMERQELEAEDLPDLQEAAQNPEALLTTLLMQGLLKNNANAGSSAGVMAAPNAVTYPATPPAETPANASNTMDIQKLVSAIKSGVVTEEQAVSFASKYGLTEEQTKKLYDFIKKKL